MKKVILILTLGLMAFAVNAQTKIGHINSSVLMEQMPEAIALQEELMKSQANWETILAQKKADLQKKYDEVLAAEGNPSTPKEMLEVLVADFQSQQEGLQTLTAKAQQSLQSEQEAKLSPLLEKVKGIIAEVAKENGYDYVMDSTEGSGMIYTNPSNDLLPLVKAKLGL